MVLENLLSQLSAEQIGKLIENMADFAVTNGVVMLAASHLPLKRYRNIPITLFPSPIPRDEYYKIVRIQPSINKLMHLISQDSDFMLSTFERIARADDFIRNFFTIYKKHLRHCNQSEVLTLGILRSDYMFSREQSGRERALQTEVNTVSSGMGSIGSQKIIEMYHTTLRERPTSQLLAHIPDNCGNPEIGRAFDHAWRAYGGRAEAVVVFFVMENETNIGDHRTLEFNIYRVNPGIRVRRKVYDHVIDTLRTDDEGRLFVDDEEVAVAYFRTCYSPKHFPTQQHWKAREIIELSRAVKCPSVAHHLVGSKVVQEILNRPGVVERYIGAEDEEACEEVRSTFAGMYTLEMNDDGDAALKMALERPECFVLKPQREGGGNNYYGQDLTDKLTEIGHLPERCGYILMDLIKARSYPNYMIMDGVGKRTDVISELGIFGCCVTRGKQVLQNYSSGYLHRVKSKEVNEGGIMSGTGSVTSPYLF